MSLKVAQGEFVSFIGPSGCGKTTLLRAVADLETPTEGDIRVDGMSTEEARLKRRYGYVFQAPALYPWRTVAGNIALPLEIMGYSKAERAERVDKGPQARQPRRLRRQVPVAIVGRHAAARLDRPRPLVRPRHSLDGRAVRGARRDRARHAEPAIAAAVGGDGQDGAVRHPFNSRRRCSCRPTSSSCRRARGGLPTSSNATFPATGSWRSARRPSSWRSPTACGTACAQGIRMTHSAAVCATTRLESNGPP